MAENPATELREKTTQELVDLLAMEKKRLFDAMMRGVSGEAVKPHEKRAGRRLIARILTVLRERSLRGELSARVAELEQEARGISPAVAALLPAEPRLASEPLSLKKVERRLPAKHKKSRHWKLTALSKADMAAVRLAEAKRKRVGLAFADPGHDKD